MFQARWTSPPSPQELLLVFEDPAQVPLALWSLSRFPVGFLPMCSHSVSVRTCLETDGISTGVICRHFLKWTVTGQQMQAAHCERSQEIWYFTWHFSLPLTPLIDPNQSQRAKEPINIVHTNQPLQGKEQGREGGERLWGLGEQKISRFFILLEWHSIAMTVFMSAFPLDSNLTLPSLSSNSALGKGFEPS